MTNNKHHTISKAEAKAPDIVTLELKKGFVWSVQHSKIVISGVLVFLVLGAGYSAYSYFSDKKESELQEKYYAVEKTYFETKEKFEKPETPKSVTDTTTDKSDKKNSKKDKSSAEKSTAAVSLASGDLDKDYGPVVKEWLNLIQQAPDSKAAAMSALHLSDIYNDYKKTELALETLKKVATKRQDLLSVLVLDKQAGIESNLGDCNSAVKTWDQLLKNKNAQFLQADIKLKKGLCYESLNDLTQAQAMYTEAKTVDANSPAAKTAEKYLRHLQSKKN